ncbi:MAG TPA: PQQ-binding-like beta-propeller repeat protein [Ktedonobacterales bacterium]
MRLLICSCGNQHVRPHALPSALLLLSLATLLLLAGCASPSSGHTATPTATATATFGPTAAPGPAPTGARWPTFGYDAARDGVNPNEAAISAGSIAGLHRVWQVALPAVADSAPVYLGGVRLPDGSTRNLLFIMTRDGRLLAVDAANGRVLWSRQPRGPKITHSSPVLDPSGRYVYAYGLDGYEHKYDVATGAEVTSGGWPVRITRFTSTEKESSDPNLANGRLYVATSGYIGDAPPYQGHVVSTSLGDASSNVFNSLCSNVHALLGPQDCSSEQSGIWARAGVVVDPTDGNLYVTTGNGPYDGVHDWGDSVLELSPDGSRLLDSWTPANQAALNDGDVDLGSMSPALLPAIPNSKTPLLLVQGGKDNLLRLINRRNLSGHGGPGHIGGELQTVNAGCGIFHQPVVWSDPGSGVWLFVPTTCSLRAYRVVTDNSGSTSLQAAWSVPIDTTSPVLAGGVLFAASDGVVVGLDPRTGRGLWRSDQASAGSSIGGIHWQSPIVIAGRLYCADEDGRLTAYGL